MPTYSTTPLYPTHTPTQKIGIRFSSVRFDFLRAIRIAFYDFCLIIEGYQYLIFTEFSSQARYFLDNLDNISKNAVADPCTGTNPIAITVDQMKELYRMAYYGA